MDRFFDRLGDLLQSLLGSDSLSSRTYDKGDPDMRQAIEELDAYLEGRDRSWQSAGGSSSGSSPPPHSVDEALRRDYATLEVAFAAPFSEVRKSYKRLLHKYHPDRFSADEQKQALANEVTQRLNDAFSRIEKQQGMPR